LERKISALADIGNDSALGIGIHALGILFGARRALHAAEIVLGSGLQQAIDVLALGRL